MLLGHKNTKRWELVNMDFECHVTRFDVLLVDHTGKHDLAILALPSATCNCVSLISQGAVLGSRNYTPSQLAIGG